jgi:hypothetical protein
VEELLSHFDTDMRLKWRFTHRHVVVGKARCTPVL